MEQRRNRQASWKQLAVSNDFNDMPPGGKVAVGASLPPREPSLTEKFNAVAKKSELKSVWSMPASKVQIEVMEKSMSQPKATLEMNPIGSVNRACSPQADRVKSKHIKMMKAQLFSQEGKLKQSFNRSSFGVGM